MLLTLHPDDLAALDAWIAAQRQPMSRQDAIRAIITAAPSDQGDNTPAKRYSR